MTAQANTAEAAGGSLNNPTGNSFLDGISAVLGFAERGVGIYGEITNSKTQREIDLFNARAGAVGTSQPPPMAASISIDGVEKLAFTVGVGLLAFVGVTAYMAKKGK